MRAADTSVVVAAFASWHEGHAGARRMLDQGLRLIAHCALESHSVLTRLPAPHRSDGNVVCAFLEARFPQPWLRLTPSQYRAFVLALPDNAVTGGTVYDALVAATAAASKAELLTFDRRAVPIYEHYGVRVRLIG